MWSQELPLSITLAPKPKAKETNKRILSISVLLPGPLCICLWFGEVSPSMALGMTPDSVLRAHARESLVGPCGMPGIEFNSAVLKAITLPTVQFLQLPSQGLYPWDRGTPIFLRGLEIQHRVAPVGGDFRFCSSQNSTDGRVLLEVKIYSLTNLTNWVSLPLSPFPLSPLSTLPAEPCTFSPASGTSAWQSDVSQ